MKKIIPRLLASFALSFVHIRVASAVWPASTSTETPEMARKEKCASPSDIRPLVERLKQDEQRLAQIQALLEQDEQSIQALRATKNESTQEDQDGHHLRWFDAGSHRGVHRIYRVVRKAVTGSWL